MAELSVKVPIRFSEKAQKDLYETCMAYKELAEMRGAENEKLRELVHLMIKRHTPISPCKDIPCGECPVKNECDQEDALMRELRIEVDE